MLQLQIICDKKHPKSPTELREWPIRNTFNSRQNNVLLFMLMPDLAFNPCSILLHFGMLACVEHIKFWPWRISSSRREPLTVLRTHCGLAVFLYEKLQPLPDGLSPTCSPPYIFSPRLGTTSSFAPRSLYLRLLYSPFLALFTSNVFE